MLVIPAIDLKGGRCVRLLQGDPDKETVYSDDPVAVARKFESLGAKLIHVVDLDGSFTGRPVNHGIVADIAGAVAVPIEIGGGIRTAEDCLMYRRLGIGRIILGTVLLQDTFKEVIGELKEFIVAGIDAKNSMVATHGWKTVSSLSSAVVIGKMIESGIKEIIYTDIAMDGMLIGPNFPALQGILKDFKGINLIASGGVSTLEDIRRLKALSDGALKGCIVGKAYYDGRIDLTEALRLE